jgi:serine/threonine protein phosphatase PrpC
MRRRGIFSLARQRQTEASDAAKDSEGEDVDAVDGDLLANGELRKSIRSRAKRSMVRMRSTKVSKGSEQLKMEVALVDDVEALAFHYALYYCRCSGPITQALATILRGLVYHFLSHHLTCALLVADKSGAENNQDFDRYSMPDFSSSDDETVDDGLDSDASSSEKSSSLSSSSSSGSNSSSGSGSGSDSNSGSNSNSNSGSSSNSNSGSSSSSNASQDECKDVPTGGTGNDLEEEEQEQNDDDDDEKSAVASSSAAALDNVRCLSDVQIAFDDVAASVSKARTLVAKHAGQLVSVAYVRHHMRKAVRPLKGVVDQSAATTTTTSRAFHAVCMRGKRNYLEDRFVLIENARELLGQPASAPPTSFVGVYDGHAGESCAVFSQIFLHWKIFAHRLFAADDNAAGGQIVRDAIESLEVDWVALAERNSLNAGTTAVLALIVGDQLTIANVGDSRCVLCSGGRALELSSIHSPAQDDEKKRIANAGGIVVFFNGWRVNGQYAVSRSIGDYPARQYLIAEPHIAERRLDTDQDEFLILASDGLWDVFTADEAVDTVRQWRDGNDHSVDIAKLLFREATRRSANDNITIVVIFLQPKNSKN